LSGLQDPKDKGTVIRNLREGDHMEELSVDGSIILKWSFKDLDGMCMDWVSLAQDGDRCWALVNAVMNLRVP
jgi:hypothetical protein